MNLTSQSSEHLSISFLGTFQITYHEQPIKLPTRKIESLFAYLVLNPGRHSREKLATLFWGDSSHQETRRSLRHALAVLRKSLFNEIILADREHVSINSSISFEFDITEFNHLTHAYLQDPSCSTSGIDIELYTGDLLEDFYDDWIIPFREQYRFIYIDTLLQAVQRSREHGNYDQAIEYSKKILDCDSTNELAYQHLMFCYAINGNRSRALEQYETCKQILQDDLNVDPTLETQELANWIRDTNFQSTSQTHKITNLPIPISSFIGRKLELAQIKLAILKARLVTLTGAGGSGKTRLAIHAAAELVDSYKDGVWWVEFAPLTDPALITHTIAKVLGIEATSQQPVVDTIIQYLQNKQLLLIFDNCEHLVNPIAQLAEALLSRCEGIKILATSREALGVVGEQIWFVPTLSVPEVPEQAVVDFLMQFEALQLYVERTRAVKPDFVLSQDNALAIANICARLDGLPLAIELAAARMRIMSARQIDARLGDRLDLLADRRITQLRHRTLQAAIDWSYDLLSDDERLMFCRLSVFDGGWTIGAAEGICTGEGIEEDQILDLICALLNKSLIVVDRSGERYRMLETIKAYARAKLEERGEQGWIKLRHLDFFLRMAETVDEKVRGFEQLIWMEKARQEHENLTTALKYSFMHQCTIEKGVLLVCALTWYWGGQRGDLITARYWLEKALKISEKLGKTSSRAKILFNAGFLSSLGINWLNPAEQQDLLEKSLEIWCELGPDFILEKAKCLMTLGFIRKFNFHDDHGLILFNESMEIFRALNQTWWYAWALNLLTLIHKNSTPQEIRSILEEEAVLWKEIGDGLGEAIQTMDLGYLALTQGNYLEAEKFFQESLKKFKKAGAKSWIFETLRYLGTTYSGLNQYEQAERYFKECIHYAQAIGKDYTTSIMYLGLGFIALNTNDLAKAESYLSHTLYVSKKYAESNYSHSFYIPKKFGGTGRIVLCIAGFASLAVLKKMPKLAARLFGAYFSHYEEFCNHIFISPVTHNNIEQYFNSCRKQLSDDEFECAWNAGSTLTLDEVIEELLAMLP